MPIIRDDIKGFLNIDWTPQWDAILDNVIAYVNEYFQEWLGWKWEQTIIGEKVYFKNYVGVVKNPIKTINAIKNEAGNALNLSDFIFLDFLIYDKKMIFGDDILYVDYVSIDIPPSIKQELVMVIASVFHRIYQLTYDKDVRLSDGGGFRINERYVDIFESAKEKLRIYQKIAL